MGKQIIKQPNGQYCIFSSVVDNVTMYNLTKDEIIEEWVNEAKNDIVERVNGIVSKLENNEQPYFQFTKSFDEMLETIKEIHGTYEYETVSELLGYSWRFQCFNATFKIKVIVFKINNFIFLFPLYPHRRTPMCSEFPFVGMDKTSVKILVRKASLLLLVYFFFAYFI